MQSAGPVEAGEDPLAIYRVRILYATAIAAVVFLIPFSINAFVQGQPADRKSVV